MEVLDEVPFEDAGGGGKSFLTVLFLASLAVITLGSDAHAVDTCPEDPDSYVQYGPDPDDEDKAAACPCTEVDFGATFGIVCDLDPSGGATSSGWIASVYDPGYGGGGAICGGNEYCAWGQMPTTDIFYCAWDHTTVIDATTHYLISVRLEGTDNADVLFFQYDTYDMDTWASETNFTGILKGMPGADFEFGSRADSGGYYTESLFGDAGDDLLCGFPGNDSLTGGAKDDILCAMQGSDANYGASGDYDYLDHGSTPMGGTDTNDGGPGAHDECNTYPGDANCESSLTSALCTP